MPEPSAARADVETGFLLDPVDASDANLEIGTSKSNLRNNSGKLRVRTRSTSSLSVKDTSDKSLFCNAIPQCRTMPVIVFTAGCLRTFASVAQVRSQPGNSSASSQRI